LAKQHRFPDDSGRVELRYRVYEPETPRDLPIELVQDWTWSEPPVVGARFVPEGRNESEAWEIVRIDDDPDAAFAGRVYFEFVATLRMERTMRD
jgi:hypothetical protein